VKHEACTRQRGLVNRLHVDVCRYNKFLAISSEMVNRFLIAVDLQRLESLFYPYKAPAETGPRSSE
jgi:hypothetical protein